LVLVVLLQLFPDKAGLIKSVWVGAGALFVLLWAGAKFLASHRVKSAAAARLAADDEEYRRYKMGLDAIRAKYDPHRDLSDPTSISQEYRDELSALHDRHQDMLGRKFGPR
jgi:hypothetical protein